MLVLSYRYITTGLFFVDGKVYMKIVVDPLLPSSITTSFYGPTTSVELYRDKYRTGINDWNADDDIYRNFLRMFGKAITGWIITEDGEW